MGRAVVPWLQDYTRHIPYGPAEVQAQMQAAKDRGIDNWLFWDPDTEYTIDAYPTAADSPTVVPGTGAVPGRAGGRVGRLRPP